MIRAPFPPLVAGGEALAARPAPPKALRKRMAEVYDAPEEAVLPIRDVGHGTELALRFGALNDCKTIFGDLNPGLAALARAYRYEPAKSANTADIVVLTGGSEANLDALAVATRAKLLVVDETYIEFADVPSWAARAPEHANLLVLRSLSFAYGLAGAPCGAAIAAPALIDRLCAVLEPHALPTPVVRLAEAALDPSRMPQTFARISDVKLERTRMAEALTVVRSAEASDGPFVIVTPVEGDVTRLRLVGAVFEEDIQGRLRILVSSREANDRALSAFGVATSVVRQRLAEIVRDTKETRIVAAVNLDAAAPVRIATGVGFFDHMLAQVAQHGGFSLALSCSGDLDIDAHHTIEDCAIAFGQALAAALGERRGIARFGFLLPMDETEAQVSIDLGGRPYLVFEGAFEAALLGAYPTQMTEHIFRSISQSLGAAIHVSVTGENDHHKTEACFKAFGRALRQAIRIEGNDVPSTKGVI